MPLQRRGLEGMVGVASGEGTPSHEPQVCGALGRYDPARAEFLARTFGETLIERYRGRRAVIFSDRPLMRWASGTTRGFVWGEDVAPIVPPRSWQDASNRLGFDGMVLSPLRRSLHTSVSGLRPLYVLPHDGSTYFATRIEPLVRSAPTRLHPDPDAWASIFLLGYPCGERTPFAEIRRLGPSSTLEQSAGRPAVVRAHRWPWGDIEPSGGKPGEVVESVEAAIASGPAGGAVSLLSGGWDSRLLLWALSRRTDLSLEAVTTGVDDGRDQEERFAAAVAGALAVPHQIVRGQASEFWVDAVEASRAMDFETPFHVWLMPAARALRGRRVTAFDGIGGDIFAKGLFLTEELVGARTAAETANLLWQRISYEAAASRMLEDGVSSALVARARAVFAETTRPFHGHPHAATLSTYRSRTRRGIALAPIGLVGSVVRVATPFLRDATVRAALGASPAEKLGGRFYREVLLAADPRLVELPSTNTVAPEEPAAPRRETAREAQHGYYLQLLRETEIATILSPEVRERLAAGNLERFFSYSGPQQFLRACALLALWRRQYAGSLADVGPRSILGL